jgi:hypothetical protein
LLGLCIVLWVVGGFIGRRTSGAKSKEVSATQSTANALPGKKGTGKAVRSQPPIDEEMAEIEALLKSRGIE